MTFDTSLRRLSAAVRDLEKVAAERENDIKTRQIDLFGGSRPQPRADNTLMAKTLDRTIERIENLLKVKNG